jgi:hypothetical protein
LTITIKENYRDSQNDGNIPMASLNAFQLACSIYDYGPIRDFGESFCTVAVTLNECGEDIEASLEKLRRRIEVAKLTDLLIPIFQYQDQRTTQLCLKSAQELVRSHSPQRGGSLNSNQQLLIKSATNYALITGAGPSYPEKVFSLDLKSLTGFLAHSQYWAVKSRFESRRDTHQEIASILSQILERSRDGKRVLRTEGLDPSEISRVKYAYALYQAEIKDDSLCKRALDFWYRHSRRAVGIREGSRSENGEDTLKRQFCEATGDVFFKASCSQSNKQLRRAYEKLGDLAEKICKTIHFYVPTATDLDRMRKILEEIRRCANDPLSTLNDVNHLNSKIEKCFSASKRQQFAIDTHTSFNAGYWRPSDDYKGLVNARNSAFLGAWTDGGQAVQVAPTVEPLGAAERLQTEEFEGGQSESLEAVGEKAFIPG